MKRMLIFCVTATLMATVVNCGKRVMIPPRIDLRDYEVVGIIEFKCSNEGKLGPLSTKRFTNAIRKDQGMIRIVALGTSKEVLKAIKHNKLDREAYEAIGENYEVKTIFTGELIISDVKPNINIDAGSKFVSLEARVNAMLNVVMFETATGASIWSASASAAEEIGGVSFLGGKLFAFNAEDPDEAYGALVNALVAKTTRDFKVTWETR